VPRCPGPPTEEALRSLRAAVAQARVLPRGRVVVLVETAGAAKFYRTRCVAVAEKRALFAGTAQLPDPGETPWDVVFPAEFLVAYEEAVALSLLAARGFRVGRVTSHCWSADGAVARVEDGWAGCLDKERVQQALAVLCVAL